MKWYNSILETLRSSFGLEQDATEAEIHAAMEKKNQSPEAIEAEETKSVDVSAIEARMDTLAQGVTALQAQVSTLVTSVETLNQQVVAANQRLAVVEKTPAAVATGADTLPAAVVPNTNSNTGTFGIELKAAKKMPGLK